MPGFRYHLVTVISIFLALGLGIIIGSSFVETAIVDRQTRQLNDLRARVNRDVEQVQARNRHYASFLEAVRPRADRVRVALVLTGDYPDTLRSVREALERAGAEVASITALDDGFGTRLRTNVARVHAGLRTAHPSMAPEPAAMLRILADTLARGGPETDLAAFGSVGLLDYQGDYSRPPDVVVLVGGASDAQADRAETVDRPMLEAMAALGTRLVYAEPLEAGVSYVQRLSGKGASTVDCADTDVGQAALVLALTGPVGDYGVKPTALAGVLPPATLSNGKRDRTRP